MEALKSICGKRSLAWALAVAALAVGGCAKVEKADAPEETAEPALAGTPIEAADVTELAMVGCATCGGPRNDGQSFLEYEGKQYGFCCPGCMELFRKDPAKFVGEEEAAEGASGGTEGADGGKDGTHRAH